MNVQYLEAFLQMADANAHVSRRHYAQALPLLLKLRRQRVERYWDQPRQYSNQIRCISLGDVGGDPTDEIILGTDTGLIVALDIQRAEDIPSWSRNLGKAIVGIQAGTNDLNKYDSILACTGDEFVYILDETGPLPRKLDEFAGEHIDCLYINRHGKRLSASMDEVLIGCTEKKIYIYDANVKNKLVPPIKVPQAARVLCSHDLTGDNSSEIIMGTAEGMVYVYNRGGKELWHYTTGGCIRALFASDIDGDGFVEVLVGSDDGNAYVLNSKGQLKWRYYTSDPVFDIIALPIANAPVSTSPLPTLDSKQGLTSEVLLGVADSYVYVLNSEGDLRWRFNAHGPVMNIRARDMNDDSTVEIAVNTGKRLDLFQVIDMQKVQSQINICIKSMQNFNDPKSTIIELTKSDDEYIRAYALVTLAGYHKHTENDFQCLHIALTDSSSEVRNSMAHAAINLIYTIHKDDADYAENMAQLKRLLQGLMDSTDQSVRLTFASLLYSFAGQATELCFSYLDRCMHDSDRWVRRTAVRQLDKLVTDYPIQTFRLLREAATSEDAWLCQESARALAHYFDAHQDELANGAYDLWRSSLQLVIQQIAHHAVEPLVRDFFTLLVLLMNESSEEQRQALVDFVQATTPTVDQPNTSHFEHILREYETFRHMLHAQTLTGIEEYWQDSRPRSSVPVYSKGIARILDRLKSVIDTLRVRRIDKAYGRAAGLRVARIDIDKVKQEVQAESVRPYKETEQNQAMLAPENSLLILLLRRYNDIVKAELHSIIPELLPSQVQKDEPCGIAIQIANEGDSKVKNVRVILERQNDTFDIKGSNERFLDTIAMQDSDIAQFIITLTKDVNELLLSFAIIYDDYDDIEPVWPHRKISFADKVKPSSTFQEIPNSYHSSQPVND